MTMTMVKEKCVRVLIEFQQMFSISFRRWAFRPDFPLRVCYFSFYSSFYFRHRLSILEFLSLFVCLSVCLSTSHFSLTLSLYLSRMVFALPESLITILLPFWRSLFSSFSLFLLWWKELIFIYLLNVTHTQCSNFYSQQISGRTFNCIASHEILWG